MSHHKVIQTKHTQNHTQSKHNNNITPSHNFKKPYFHQVQKPTARHDAAVPASDNRGTDNSYGMS